MHWIDGIDAKERGMKKEIDDKGNVNKIPEKSDWDYYFRFIKPHYDAKGEEVPWYLEPDAFEGWKRV